MYFVSSLKNHPCLQGVDKLSSKKQDMQKQKQKLDIRFSFPIIFRLYIMLAYLK